MSRFRVLLATAVLLATDRLLAESEAPFVHLQTDRPSYRLGETIWFRVHGEPGGPVTVSLEGPRGAAPGSVTVAATEKRPAAGHLLIDRDLDVGRYRLVALATGREAHAVPLEIYELALPRLRLELTVLGEVYYPGETVVASFRATDRSGRPISGARVEYLARLGDVSHRDAAGLTDAGGRALIRFRLPADVEQGGFLSAGVSCKAGEEAVSQPLAVSASVARIDFRPEGGTIVAGHVHRLTLLARDGNGEPTAARGRIVDEEERGVGRFEADARGLGSVVVPYEEGRVYHAIVEQPAGVSDRFPLPAPTGHPISLLLARGEKQATVTVRGTAAVAGRRAELALATPSGMHPLRSVSLSRRGDALPTGTATLSPPVRQGIGYLVASLDGRVRCVRPVFLGAGGKVEVTLHAVKDQPLLAGRALELELQAKLDGQPLAMDVALSLFHGPWLDRETLVGRRLFSPCGDVRRALPLDLLAAGDEAGARRDDFLLLHGAVAPPAEDGPEAAGSFEGLAAWRAPLPEVPPRRPAASASARDDAAGATVVRPTGLERRLHVAPYTRSPRAQESDHRVEIVGTREQDLVAPEPGGEASTLPQARRRSGRVDARRTLFWGESVKTDRQGRATIRVRLGDLVQDLSWVAEGTAGLHPVSAQGKLEPTASFAVEVAAPAHLTVGDTFDVPFLARVIDGSDEPLDIEILPPPCLKPLARTRLTYRRQEDAPRQRFLFEAVAPAADAELRVVSQRGIHRDVRIHRLGVFDREVELVLGASGHGTDSGQRTFVIPTDAMPGTVRLRATASPGVDAQAWEWLTRLLHEPTGCFEQTTSTNYVNLALLDALREAGGDPEVLERAYTLGRLGFQRLLSFRAGTGGAFSHFPGGAPEPLATAVALRHLALYTRLFHGLGAAQLDAALDWLETQHPDLETAAALHLTLDLHEAGKSWSGAAKALETKPRSRYELALLAACLATAPRSLRPSRRDEAIAARRESVCDALERQILAQGPAMDGGVGLFGSAGPQCDLETAGIAALALHAAGRAAAAAPCIAHLAAGVTGVHQPQTTAVALRAYGRLVPFSSKEATPLQVTFAPGGREQLLGLPTLSRPLVHERLTELGPGDKAAIQLSTGAGSPCFWDVGCSYRVAAPRSSPQAPYRITCEMTPVLDQNAAGRIRATIEPVKGGVTSQVIVRIGLPGGCVPAWDGEARPDQAARAASGISHREVKEGYVDLYWAHGLSEPAHIEVPVRGLAPGSFRGRPSMVYPYYDAGKLAYAPALELRVNHPWAGVPSPRLPGGKPFTGRGPVGR